VRTRILGLAAGLALALGAANASALPVVPGGWTLIEVTAIDDLNPLSPQVIAPGEVGTLFGDTFLRFPVTDVTQSGNQIQTVGHSGGISLSGGGNTVELTNFVIDLPSSTVNAELNGSGQSDFALFDIVPCIGLGGCQANGNNVVVTGYALNLTSGAASQLSSSLDTEIAAGFQVGILKQVEITQVIPEPSTALLGLSGLVGLAVASRRRRA